MSAKTFDSGPRPYPQCDYCEERSVFTVHCDVEPNADGTSEPGVELGHKLLFASCPICLAQALQAGAMHAGLPRRPGVRLALDRIRGPAEVPAAAAEADTLTTVQEGR